MTISKERFATLCLEVALEQVVLAGETEAENVWDDETKAFIVSNGLALIKRMEAEQEVFLTLFQHEDTGRNTSLDCMEDAERFKQLNPRWFETGKAIKLPLVEE